MTKNVFSYLSCGFKVAARNFKNLSNLVKYWIYIFTKILSIIFLPLFPAVLLAKYKIGNKDNEKINLIDSYNTVNSIKKYWNVVFLLMMMVFLILACLFTLVLIFGSLTILGSSKVLATIILAIPLSIAILLFVIFTYCYLYPTLALANADFDATDCLKSSLKVMRDGGKLNAIILLILSNFIKSTIISAIFTVPTVLFLLNGFDIIFAIISFICIVIFFFVYPFISYSLLVAKVSFKSDLISKVTEINDDYSTEEVELINILNSSKK